MRRLFACSITLVCKDAIGCSRVSSYVADRHEFWWNHVKPEDRGQWRSEIRFGEGVFTEIIRHPVPLDMNILKALNQSSLGLDLYLWINYRTFGLDRPLRISWKRLYEQIALNPARAATDKNAVNDFRAKAIRELIKIKLAWPGLDYATPRGALELLPSTVPSVPALTKAGRNARAAGTDPAIPRIQGFTQPPQCASPVVRPDWPAIHRADVVSPFSRSLGLLRRGPAQGPRPDRATRPTGVCYGPCSWAGCSPPSCTRRRTSWPGLAGAAFSG